jgi:hypothetical protein
VVSELLIIFKNGTPSPEEWREFTESLTVEVPENKFITIL